MNRPLRNGLIVAAGMSAIVVGQALAAAVQDTAARPADSTPLPPASERFAGGAKSDEVPDFRRHIEPLFGRLGCNGRACHGSFQGRGGFHLSLFGYDAVTDHQTLLTSTDGKVDVKHPGESLILKKPTLTIDHEGGLRMKRGDWEYRMLLKWIEGGAKLSNSELPAAKSATAKSATAKSNAAQANSAEPVDVASLDVSPAEIVFHKPGETVQLRAIVHWTDGTSEDVTPLCRYQSNDDALAKVDSSGRVTCLGKGDTQVVAYYDNGITPVPVFLPLSDLVGPRYPATPTNNRIDELVLNKLKKLGITQSPLSDDAEFLRRTSLDVTGTLPAPDEIRVFLADRSADKRQRKIDELLSRPAYAAWWATRLCDLTGNNANQIQWFDQTTASLQWYDWMYDRMRRNVPYDKIVAGLLLATSREPGEDYAAYCRRMATYNAPHGSADFAASPTMPFYWARNNFRNPNDMALGFCYTFLGVQMQCCQCHKHPFDRWTKQDFDDFSRFFTRVGFGVAPEDRAVNNELTAVIRGQAEGGLPPDMKTVALAAGAVKRRAEHSADTTTVSKGSKAKIVVATVASAANRAAKKAAKKNADFNKLLTELGQQGKVIPLQEVFLLPKAGARPAKKEPPKNNSAKAKARPIPAANAKLLGGEMVDLNQYDDPRQALVEWLRRNPTRYFARVIVNRVWATYFNVGIVQPTDDLNQAHPPSNPELLDYLTRAFVEHGYDLKWLHREILNSRTYQLSWQPNSTNRLDEHNFSHAIPRRLPAEVAYDALRLATAGSAEWKLAMEQPVDRAIGLDSAGGLRPGKPRQAANRYALTVFGKPRRLTNCDCERSMEPSLLQTFFLQNDQEVLTMLDRDGGWLAETTRKFGAAMRTPHEPPADASAKRGKPPVAPKLSPAETDGLVQEAFLRTLSRMPQPAELARGREAIADSETPRSGLRDLLWALLNTKEFILNH